jgi:hypothetical protein
MEREINWGLSRNVIDGVTHVLAVRDRVIVVEDDLVVSPGFLSYMNHALSIYQASPQVFSVSGYNYPEKLLHIPNGYSYDAFFVTRHMCWGWATWRERWQRTDWDVRGYETLRLDASWRRSFREGGVDLPGMLNEQKRGQIDSWAIRWTYAHFANHAVCLVPVHSLVNNMGADGSGVHMQASRRYYHSTLNGEEPLHLPSLVYVDPKIARRFKKVEKRSIAYRAARKATRLLQNQLQNIQRRRRGEFGSSLPQRRFGKEAGGVDGERRRSSGPPSRKGQNPSKPETMASLSS